MPPVDAPGYAPPPQPRGSALIGRSQALKVVQQEVEYAARSDAKVLITGASGVGKEVVAHLIHQRSRRRHAPMLTINCAAMPDTLLESELFGHARGSFTDAYRDKRGLFEAANSGTVFMDEVGEMSLRMQALLLRFLETGEIQRVGDERNRVNANVRVVAATNRRLPERIAAGEFREDLYYRLNVIHITIPPLRERKDDVTPLLDHFLRLFAVEHGVPLPQCSPDAIAALEAYDWPGNVRELRNIAERLTCRCPGGVIQADDLPLEVRTRSTPAESAPARVAAPVPAQALLDRILLKGESFWDVAYEPFMARDLTRDDVRHLVRVGLEQTRGNYKALVQLFNMEPQDYKRFLNFLRKYGCHMPFQRFRMAPGREIE
ncbi:MAG: sigma-54-dependent Fis family transcriptional regulator [Acidobacteria bacterium]|nr:sigma-54-dependent Fis family transcriptional regulator [Acidobacteriota bacterium]